MPQGSGRRPPTSPARETRERTAMEKAESPGLSEQVELDAKVRVFRNKRRGPLTFDEEIQVPDPFAGLYESDYLDAKDEKAAQEILSNLAGVHRIDKWLGLRKTERERIVRLREEAELEYLTKQEEGVSEGVLKIAAQTVIQLQKTEDRLISSTILQKQNVGDVVVSHALEVEDDRAGVVETVSRNLIIAPEFHPGVLEQLVLNCSSLLQLTNAMEVNCDATGWELVPNDNLQMEEAVEEEMPGPSPDQLEEVDRQKLTEDRAKAAAERTKAERAFQEEVDKELEGLEGFFKEPWPGMSFTTLRRELRVDEERTGNAYMEVLRNTAGEIIFARHIDTKLMRMVRLDDPVVVEKTLERGGHEVTIPMSFRERRYVEQVGGGALVPRFQLAGSSAGTDPDATGSTLGKGNLFTSQGVRIIYFKEFGASRDLDMWTGIWAPPGEVIPMERRATEIIHFGVTKSARTPYSLPRWINNLPSVLGSRKAEEFNLAFFNAGGVPPMLITVAGGSMSERTKDAIDRMMNTENPASKHQAVVLEVTGTGRMDKGQNRVQVSVERFGSDRMQDAMFMKYEEASAKKIRQSFRLPPVFEGDADSHNFNTVKSSYLVAEAQVFQPERDEFDEIVTMKLLRNMPDGENFRFHSLPLVIDDADQQVKCIEIAADKNLVSGEQIVGALNKVCGLEFQFDQESADLAREERMSVRMSMAQAFARTNDQGEAAREEQVGGGSPPQEEIQDDESARSSSGGGGGAARKIEKADLMGELDGLVVLGVDLADAMSKGFESAAARRDLRKNTALFEDLPVPDKQLVEKVMALRGLGGDRDDLIELFGCAAAIIASNAGEPQPEA